MNPTTEELKVQRHNEQFVFSWENPVWVANGVRVAFPLRPVSNGAYLSLSLKDNEFMQYLQEVDGFMTEWTEKYNNKYNTEYMYQTLVRDPQKYDDDDNLVINQEALERYGHHFDARISGQRGRCRLILEREDGEEMSNPRLFDIEGFIHQGAIISVSMSPSLYLHEDILRVIPKITRVLVVESDHGLTKCLLKAVKPVKKVEDIEL